MLNLAVERTWLRTSCRLMGCTVELMIDGPPSLVPLAIARLRALERVWTRFSPASELNRLLERPGEWVSVSPELFSALRWCHRLQRETGGLFDPTIRTALEAWGYDRTFLEIDRSTLRPPAAAAGLATARTAADHRVPYELDALERRVRVAAGTSIDLGGIGKGLGADMVAAEMITAGARGVYASLGGDIHVAGEAPPEGWDVPLLHPVTGAPFAHHPLDNGGLVMSTVAIRKWNCGEVAAHHIIDPRTGAPAQTDVIAVAVATRSSARAEALAKAALVAGSSAGRALLERAEVKAWIVLDDEVETVEADRCWQ
jgi:FAD:protein FMN transferase